MKFIRMDLFRVSVLAAVMLAGCTAGQPAAVKETTAVEPTAVQASPTPTAIISVTATPEKTSAQSSPKSTQPTPTAKPDAWKDLPVIPTVSARAKEIFQKGLASGNNPGAYSKVGDCESTPTWFLGDFDAGKERYNLGDYSELQAVIDQFKGSHQRTSLAARRGANAASILTALWADPKQCQANETPLACEFRLNKPSIALIMLGTNDVNHMKNFEPQMRLIIEYCIDNGVVPVLATKADDLEKDGSINATIARLAVEYDIPLWNFWKAVQPLPDHGLQEDGSHLTWSPNFFNDPENLKRAWPVRNLTALQVLDAVWKGVSEK